MSQNGTLDTLRRAGRPEPGPDPGLGYLPNAVEPEDLVLEVIAGSDAEVFAVLLKDDMGRRWLYKPVSIEEMQAFDPDALRPVRDYSRQRT